MYVTTILLYDREIGIIVALLSLLQLKNCLRVDCPEPTTLDPETCLCQNNMSQGAHSYKRSVGMSKVLKWPTRLELNISCSVTRKLLCPLDEKGCAVCPPKIYNDPRLIPRPFMHVDVVGSGNWTTMIQKCANVNLLKRYVLATPYNESVLVNIMWSVRFYTRIESI